MKRLWLVLLLAVPLGCQPPADDAAPSDSNSTAAATSSDATTTQMVLAIDGMECSIACPPAVENTLSTLPGVASVDVDFESKRATLDVVDGQFDVAAATQALSSAGFTGTKL